MPKNLKAGTAVVVKLTAAAGGGVLKGHLVEPVTAYGAADGIAPATGLVLVGPWAQNPLKVAPNEVELMRYLPEAGPSAVALTRAA